MSPGLDVRRRNAALRRNCDLRLAGILGYDGALVADC